MAIEVIIEVLCGILESALTSLILGLAAWLSIKIGKKVELATINEAQRELCSMAVTTVNELMQTTVCKLKAASADGKLSAEDIKELNVLLVEKTVEKMSGVSLNLLRAAGVDINKLIVGAGEEWIDRLKKMP